MRHALRLLALLLLIPSLVLAQSTTNQTIQTVPSSNTTFLSDLQNFLRQEDASRYAHHFTGMVVSGGTHATGAGLTWAPAALTAYVDAGNYITESGSVVYTNNKQQWVIATNAITGNLANFVRVSGTHYLIDAISGAKPSLPSGAIWLMEVTTAGGAVTVVTDLRSRVVYAGTYLQAELPSAGVRGRIAFVRDSGTGAMFFDNGSAWASIGLTNPMTTAGDIIYGGVAGVPTRTACATAGTVLQGGAPPACTATPTVTTLTTSGQNAVSVGPFGAAAGNTGEQRFLELAANGANYVGFKAPDSLAANKVWVLPSADGSANQVLQTNGSGTLSFAGSTIVRGALAGLKVSNNAGDAANDLDIAVGAATDSANTDTITLASALTKQLDASWAVGTNQGCIDTGAAANNTWHIFVIRRTDTNVVDVLCSLSATAPTMPASYSLKRRIASVVRAAATNRAFVQDGFYFRWNASAADINSNNPGTAAVTRTLTLPLGINVYAIVTANITAGAGGVSSRVLLSDLAATDEAASGQNNQIVVTAGAAEARDASWQGIIRSNTSGQIRSRLSASDANTTLSIGTVGYWDYLGTRD